MQYIIVKCCHEYNILLYWYYSSIHHLPTLHSIILYLYFFVYILIFFLRHSLSVRGKSNYTCIFLLNILTIIDERKSSPISLSGQSMTIIISLFSAFMSDCVFPLIYVQCSVFRGSDIIKFSLLINTYGL